MSMYDAIHARLSKQQPRTQEFIPDPDLEEQAARLERLRADFPEQYAAPGLAGLRQRVHTYNNRKAAAQKETDR